MLRKLAATVTLAAALTVAPNAAQAQSFSLNSCAVGGFLCTDFTFSEALATDPGAFKLLVDYNPGTLGFSDSGILTGFGIYGNGMAKNRATPNEPNATLGAGSTGWGSDCHGLNGGPTNPNGSWETCASHPGDVSTGLDAGEPALTFFLDATNSSGAITNLSTLQALFTSGTFNIRTHMQSVSSLGCSFKGDTDASNRPGVDEDHINDKGCGSLDLTPHTPPSTTTPEPISMMLLGSGLLGVGAIRRRRRGGEVVND